MVKKKAASPESTSQQATEETRRVFHQLVTYTGTALLSILSHTKKGGTEK